MENYKLCWAFYMRMSLIRNEFLLRINIYPEQLLIHSEADVQEKKKIENQNRQKKP